jgi:hypothetical protein
MLKGNRFLSSTSEHIFIVYITEISQITHFKIKNANVFNWHLNNGSFNLISESSFLKTHFYLIYWQHLSTATSSLSVSAKVETSSESFEVIPRA